MIRRPPGPPPFPYTTLFRSRRAHEIDDVVDDVVGEPHLRGSLRRGVEEVRRRSEEHTSELQSLRHLVCRLLLEKKKLRAADLQGTVHAARRERSIYDPCAVL